MGVRNHFPDFLKICDDNNLHFLIVTGGFSDVTATIINKYINVNDYENLEIFGNEMVFNKDGLLIDTEMKINPVGKRLTITNEKVGNRKNVFLLGDILPDVNMVKNVNYDNLIAIGFLNKPKDY